MPGPKHTSIRIERDLDAALKPFIVSAALPKILAWLRQDAVRLAFSTRKSRTLGYYCPPKHKARSEADYHRGFDSLHTISLQVDLNPYALLFVLIHEWAHLLTRKKYGNEVYPHGREWKENFKQLFLPFHSTHIFPADILQVIDDYFLKTSPYFESRLEEACHRYGKDRKTFSKIYMNLLRQGITIPAPYMGIQAEYLLQQIQQNQQAQAEKEESLRIARMLHELQAKKEEKIPQPAFVAQYAASVGKLPIQTIIRTNCKEFRIIEKSAPLIRIQELSTGQEARIHPLLQVEVLKEQPS